MEFDVKNDDEIFGTLLNASNADFLSFELTEGLEKLFATYSGGVFTCRNSSVGVMKVGEIFFMFDSHSRGPTGLVDGNGKAVLIRFTNLSLMTRHLRVLYKNNDYYTLTPLEVRRKEGSYRNEAHFSESFPNANLNNTRLNKYEFKKSKKRNRCEVLARAREIKKQKREEINKNLGKSSGFGVNRNLDSEFLPVTSGSSCNKNNSNIGPSEVVGSEANMEVTGNNKQKNRSDYRSTPTYKESEKKREEKRRANPEYRNKHFGKC